MFVVCTLASALGVWLPAVGLRNAGPLAKRTSISIYRATTDREFVRKLFIGYNRSSGKRIGGAIIAILSPHAGGCLKEYIDDAHDAMDTIGGVSDEDARAITKILAITIWTFLLLHLVMAALVVRELVNSTYRKSRLIAAAALALVVTAVAIAIHLGCREAVWQANDELGHDAFGLGSGAYAMIPIASVTGFVAAVALVIARIRQRVA